MYEAGDKLHPRDVKEALIWYKKGAAAGDNWARDNILELQNKGVLERKEIEN
jgi:TPR repeat protein